MKSDSIISNNKKALFNFNIKHKLECGIVLKGSEVKALKCGYLFKIENGFVSTNKHLHIVLYNTEIANHSNNLSCEHNPKRLRILLLHKFECYKLQKFLSIHGQTCIPLKAYIKHGLIKLEIAMCTGRKKIEKKRKEKQNTMLRNIQTEKKLAERLCYLHKDKHKNPAT